MSHTDFTRKELNWLLKLRRKPRTWQELQAIYDTPEDGMNIMLSRLSELYYIADDEPITKGLITLNQIGETVAQAEFDRRFDMYYTRVMALAGLFTSIAAIIVSVFI